MERRLAAVLAADMVGYSRLMASDEEAALAILNECRTGIDALINEAGGRIFSSAGDGLIAEFQGPVAAVRCALAIQNWLAGRNAEQPKPTQAEFRIGAHLGDVMAEGDNLFGDGVNIAARLETLAQPGTIYISDLVHASIRNKLDIAFEDGVDIDVHISAAAQSATHIQPRRIHQGHPLGEQFVRNPGAIDGFGDSQLRTVVDAKHFFRNGSSDGRHRLSGFDSQLDNISQVILALGIVGVNHVGTVAGIEAGDDAVINELGVVEITQHGSLGGDIHRIVMV